MAFLAFIAAVGPINGGEKMSEISNRYERIDVQAYSGNCHEPASIELYQGEPYMNLYVESKGKRSGVTMLTADAIKLRDALNRKFAGYVPPPAKSYRTKPGYGYSGVQQIVRTETKTETQETIVAVLPANTSKAELDKMLAALRA